ncbi:MAG: hypothetical protein AAF558_12830 [Verrucomicrobiota bacterium]
MTAPLVYTFSLTQVAVFLGISLCLLYGGLLINPYKGREVITGFPRHYLTGVILTIIATTWFLWLLQIMDLMEYTPHRPKFFVGFFVLAVACILYLKEFLSVRALGVILLLFAKVMLDAAFLREESSKYLVVVLAYVIVIKGIIYVAWPYLMRDGIELLYSRPSFPKYAFLFGLGIGIALIIFGLFLY